MNPSLNKALHYCLVLAVLGAVCAGGVATTYAVFQPRIEQLKAEAEQKALAEVLPTDVRTADGKTEPVTPRRTQILDSDTGRPFEPASEAEKLRAVHVVADAAEPDRIVGYAAKGRARGYGGPVDVIVGVRADRALTVFNVTVTSQNETPGLGANCQVRRTNKNFWQKLFGDTDGEVITVWTDQYGHAGKRLTGLDEGGAVSADLRVGADGGEVDAISGATITSRAVSAAVADAVATIAKVTVWDGRRQTRLPVEEVGQEADAPSGATPASGQS